MKKNIVKNIILWYIPLSLLCFWYLGYNYLKSEVYDLWYQNAVLDIAKNSLASEWCEKWVILGLGNEKYTYIKNVECIQQDIPIVNDQWIKEDDFILPHLLDETIQ